MRTVLVVGTKATDNSSSTATITKPKQIMVLLLANKGYFERLAYHHVGHVVVTCSQHTSGAFLLQRFSGKIQLWYS